MSPTNRKPKHPKAAGWALAASLGAVFLASAGSAHAQIQVVVTSKPIHSLVAAVMGDLGKVTLIVDGNASAHTYALKPSDARAFNTATVVFRTSEAMEPFTAKVVKSIPKSVEVVTLAQAPGVMSLPMRKDPNFEKHGHSHGHSHAHGHGKSADQDPHVWLNPDNAKAMVDHIAKVLTPRLPAAADKIAGNAGKLKAAIDTMAAEIGSELAPLAGRGYVVFHDAYQYLEARYGLTPVGAFVVNPDVPASGKRLSELRKRVQTLGATCVFAEPNFEAKVVDAVIEGTPARRGTLDPEGASLEAGPDLYLRLMRTMSKELKRCLSGTS